MITSDLCFLFEMQIDFDERPHFLLEMQMVSNDLHSTLEILMASNHRILDEMRMTSFGLCF